MRVLEEFLKRQDGVLTREHARSAGISQDAINRRLRSGRWLRCSPGVYFVDDRPFTDAARVRAAVWGCGDHAVASGLAAAWWHGLTKFAPQTVEVTVPRSGSGRAREGTRIRRRELASCDIVECRDLRVTGLALTVIEAAVRRGGGPSLMDSALQRDAELRGLWTAHLRNKGRHGSPAARRLLQVAGDGARSAAERLFIRLLKEAGITGWKANYPVAGYKVDVAFPKARVVCEIDGLAFHSDSDDFHNDRVRQNAIAIAGWQVLRFTWLDLTEYPQRVIAIVRHSISV
jgi:very-short-patch-repair endonuclease